MRLLESPHGPPSMLHSTHQPVTVLSPLPRGLRILFLVPRFSGTCILLLALSDPQ